MRKRRKIVDLEIDEISLVDKAANRKKFYLTKRGTTMKNLIKLIKSIFGEDPTDVELKKIEALTPESQKDIEGALQVFETYGQDLPDDVNEAAATLTKSAIYGIEAKPEEITIEKIGARLSKATKDDLQKIKAIVDKMLGEDKKEGVEKKYGALPAEIQERLAKLDVFESAETEEIRKKADDEKAKIVAEMKTLGERLAKIENRKVRKSLDGQDGEEEEPEPDPEDKMTKGDKKKDKIPLWPSIQIGPAGKPAAE